MANFNDLKVVTRLAMVFLSTLILLLMIAGLSVYNMQHVAQATDELITKRLYNERLIAEWKTIISVNAARTLGAGKSVNETAQRIFESQISSNSARATKIIDELNGRITDSQARLFLKEILAQRQLYQTARTAAFREKASGDFEKATAFFDNELGPAAAAYEGAVDKLLQRQQTLITEIDTNIHNRSKVARQQIFALGTVATILSIVLAIIVSRSILSQLGGEPGYTRTITNRIAGGDLSVKINSQNGNEVSLLRAIETMKNSLSAIVREVRTGTDHVVYTSAELASGVMDLSSRTEQQASALEETTSAMQQLRSIANQNGQKGAEADQRIRAASQIATQGERLVGRVISAMGEINSSAHKIVDIISVIDSIAFQTNILALNAAVEAARAGEQGKGFAVVASEVRNLAQRSATAAKEIKNLIVASVDKVEEGTELVGQTGVTMKKLLSSVETVSDIMIEITNAGAEQDHGITQIHSAITQMDSMTQQNSALVEEAAAAAASLQELAVALQKSVSTFQLGDGP